jgi:DNA repair protein RecO (recombination protein O)
MVLRAISLRESDRIISFFSPRHGRLDGVARGARRPRSRLVGAAEPLVRGHLTYFRREGRELGVVDAFDIIQPLAQLRSSLEGLLTLGYLAELLLATQARDDDAEMPYHDLRVLLDQAECGQLDPIRLARFAELRILVHEGYSLELDRCVHCGQPPEPPIRLGPEEGGLICARCVPGGERGLSVTPAVLAALRFCQQSPAQALSRLHLDLSTQKMLERVTSRVLGYRLERPMRSWPLLHLTGPSNETD